MQQVLDAKAETRAEVMKEVEEESRAAKVMKDEAAHHVELIRAAEGRADEAKAEMEEYKARFDKAKAEAKAETDEEAANQLNVVMRNAALEMRDKLKFVEQQTEGHVKRAVAEAVRLEQAKAAADMRDAIRELEEKHEAQVQEMKDVIGAGAMHKISQMQELQDDRIQHAVKQALARQRGGARA